MHCKVNKELVEQKCYEIAQEIHEEFAKNKTNIENEKQTLNKEIEQIITVAPYFRQELKTDNKEILEEATETAKIRAQKLANLLNFEIEAVETIGGTYLGKSEITYKYRINSNDQEKIDLFASLMGDLSFEYQDATIAANYVSKGNGNAIELVYKVPDGTTIKDIKKTLKDNEIEGSSFSFKNNELSIIAFSAEELENLINKLNNNTNYEYKQDTEQNSRYLDNESRRNLYKAWLTKELREQNRGLYYACSKALAICEAAGKYEREDQERQRIEAAKQAASNWDKEHPEIYNEFTDNHLTIEEQQIKAQAIADGTFMKAPNGNPTNLNERQWLQVRTKAFKDWFGDWENNPEQASKVVDENGEPLIVYHGSRTKENINVFNTKITNGIGHTYGIGTYFTPDTRSARNYAKNDKVYSVFLNIKNPINIDDLEGTRDTYTENAKRQGYDGTFVTNKYIKNILRRRETPRILSEDNREVELLDEIVVYNPNQIKSATDNVGTFSEKNDDIMFNKKTQIDVFNFIKKHLFDLWHYEPTRETKEKHKVVHKYLNDENEIWLTKFLNDENEKGDIQYDANLSEKAIKAFLKEKGLSDLFYVKPVYKFGTIELVGKKLVFNPNPFEKEIQEHSDINDIATETGGKYNLTLLGFLQKRLGVPFKSITQKEAKELLKDKYDSSINAFNLNGTAYFIKGRKINADIKSEEMLHPFIASMHKNNPEVFTDLLKDARKLFPQLHIDIANTYLEEQVDEELVTQALARVFVEEKKKNSIPRTMQDFIDKFKKWVVSIFTKNPELKLNDFTLQDIAELINSDIEIYYEKTFGLNLNKLSKDTNTSPVVDPENKIIQSSTAEESQAYEEKLNNTFPLPEKSIAKRIDEKTILLQHLDDVVHVYDIKNADYGEPIKRNTLQSENMNRSVTNIEANENNINLLSRLRSIAKRTEALVQNYKKKYINANLNRVEKAEVKRNFKILSIQKQYLDSILNDLDPFDTNNIITNVDSILDMLKDLYSVLKTGMPLNGALNNITDIDIFEIFDNLNKTTEIFFNKYGVEKSSYLNQISDNELINKITEQKIEWLKIKESYVRLREQMIDKLFETAHRFERDDNFKSGLRKKWEANLERQKQEGLPDLGDAYKFFALDSAMEENTVIPKIITMLDAKIQLECDNEFFEIDKRFNEVIDDLKKIGINLNDKKSYEKYFLEYYKNGTETGNLISCFTPEFRDIISSFMNLLPSKRTYNKEDQHIMEKKMKQFVDEFDVINIFKLSAAHNPQSGLYKMLLVLSRVKGNIDENTGRIYLIGKDWEKLSQRPEYAYDEAYENEIRKKLGPDFDKILAKYINLFEQAFEQRDEFNNIMDKNVLIENNPFHILKLLVDAKKTGNYKSVSGPNGIFYNLNKMFYIPSNNKYYNEQYAQIFSDTNPNKEIIQRAYELFREIYGEKIGTMYFSDADNLAFAKIKSQKLWAELRSTFLRDRSGKKDPGKMNMNYSDEYKRIYYEIYSGLSGMSKLKMVNLAINWGVTGLTSMLNDNTDINTLRSIIANEIASRTLDFETDFVKATKNILRLYSEQKRNNIMAEYMSLLYDKFVEITTNPKAIENNTREAALEVYKDQLYRGYKRQGNNESDKKINEYKLEKIKKEIKDLLDAGLDATKQIKSLIKANKKHLLANEKAIVEKLIDILKTVNDIGELNNNFSFIYKEKKYTFFIHPKFGKQFRKESKPISEEDFIEAREDYIMEKILEFGKECGVDSIMEGVSNLIRLKALGGYVSALIPGFKNRIDGLVADTDIDATGIPFTPGNLAWAQRFLFGSMLPMGLSDSKGGLAKFKLTKAAEQRFAITKYLGKRMALLQDMTNTLDKNVSRSLKTQLKTNLSPYNIAIQLPEIRNQYDLFIARLHDYYVTDKTGKKYRFVDKINGKMGYTMLYMDENGELKLKDDFNPDNFAEGTSEYENTKYNKQWITFDTEIESRNNTLRLAKKKDVSDVVKLKLDHEDTNALANGDYRETFRKLYSKNVLLRTIMNLKTYAPKRFQRAWSAGNNEQMIGLYRTMWQYGGYLSSFIIVLNAFNNASEKYNISRGRILTRKAQKIVYGTGSAIMSLGMIHILRKSKPNTKAYQRILFEAKFLKALMYEMVSFPFRFVGMKTNPVEFTFKDNDKIFKDIDVIENENDSEDYTKYKENELKDRIKMHKGNVCALARSVARDTYAFVAKVAFSIGMFYVIKGIFSDDDDSDRNKKENIDPKINFVLNTIKNISESCSLLYQMTFGLFDSYKTVISISLIDNIFNGVQKLVDNKYKEGIEQILTSVIPIRTTLWKKFSSDYKTRDTDWAMVAFALDDENLDEQGYYDKYFEKQSKLLRKYIKEDFQKTFDKGKEIYEKTQNKYGGFTKEELDKLESVLERKNNNARENKIEIDENFNIYKLTTQQFDDLIDYFLPRNDNNREDLFGKTHKETNRQMVQTLQKWYEQLPSLDKPIGLEDFDKNPTYLMDLVHLIKENRNSTNKNMVEYNEKNNEEDNEDTSFEIL